MPVVFKIVSEYNLLGEEIFFRFPVKEFKNTEACEEFIKSLPEKDQMDYFIEVFHETHVHS